MVWKLRLSTKSTCLKVWGDKENSNKQWRIKNMKKKGWNKSWFKSWGWFPNWENNIENMVKG